MNQIFGMDKFSSITKYQPTQNAKKAEHTNTSSTIGNPKLSEKAASYYEELKAKYGDVDFVLVSNDQKENATELAANRQTNKSMTVLISEDEVEEMPVYTKEEVKESTKRVEVEEPAPVVEEPVVEEPVVEEPVVEEPTVVIEDEPAATTSTIPGDETVVIEDEEVARAAKIDEENCWIHWLILALMAAYTTYEIARCVVRNKKIKALSAVSAVKNIEA